MCIGQEKKRRMLEKKKSQVLEWLMIWNIGVWQGLDRREKGKGRKGFE